MKAMLKELLQPTNIAIAGAVWLIILSVVMAPLLRFAKLVRQNFRAETIPVAYGLLIAAWASPMLVYTALRFKPIRFESLAMLACILGFGLLGFLDDLLGDRSVTGLRGHFRRFFKDGVVTTGFVKAVGGLAIAIAIPRMLLERSWPDSLLDGIVIALCANAMNLFDLRPGRCVAVFLLAASPLWVISLLTHSDVPPILLYIWVPALLCWERDARAKAMLGDTGSNLLGASMGLALVVQFPAARLAVVVILVALHVVAEKWSITKIIEKTPVLKQLDRLTGVR
jgi:UDP-N-acetylmuramyl pentapeptide phosphotransferase/UDP-N-acetylglucosamine-1-phosphate transferase